MTTTFSVRALSVCIVLALCAASCMSAPASAVRGLSILSRRAHEFDHYFEAPASKPNDTRVVTGVLEVLAAVPMTAATANGSAKFVEHAASSPHANPLRLRKYLLHADGMTHALTFNNFEDAMPPVYLATGNMVSVDGLVSAPGPHPFHGLESFAIGVQAGEAHVHSRLSTSSKYSVGGTTSLNALFVLIDFADAPNSCQAAAPSGVSGKDFLNSLIFTGNYHSGKSVAGLYNTESNGRFQLVSSGSRIAGPYTMSQFNTGQDCNANYATWVSAAKAQAAADGYNLASYGTIVVISPTPKGCFWAGLATLSGACQPGVTTYNPPLCFSSFLMCVPFVVAHELGHNIGLEHSGIDSSNSAPSTSNVYGDWGCTMGNRNGWNRVNAHKAYVMGWLAQSRVVELQSGSASATYTLSPLDTPDSQTSGPTLITFLDKSSSPTKTYFFSSRATSGYADSLPAPYNAGVSIHYKTSDNQYSWFVSSIPAGGSFTAPVTGYKFTVSTFQSGSGAATLQVTSPGGSAPPPPPPTSTDTYSWQTGAWSGCSVNCGTGTQTRTVTCVGSVSGPVSSSLCANAGTAPASSQACTVSNCVSYSWTAGNWGACSASCGSGTQTRSVTCTSSSGGVVANSYCSGSMSNSQSCYAGTCPSYSWSTGAWSACSSTCGTGTQSRTVTCVDQTGAAVSASSCSSAGAQPATSQSCSSGSACPSFSWYSGGWSACSSTCGSGSQTRSVSCLGSDGYSYSDSYCSAAGSKPSASQSCSGPACTTYSWNTGSWSACSASCGTGTQSRSVTCVSSGGAAQVDSYCSGAGTKPASSQSCSASASCSTYSWYTGPYGACSVSCGTGTQSRSVYCRDQYGYAVSDSSCSSSGTKPATQSSCSPGACPSSSGSSSSYSNFWAVGAWGTCVVSCPFGGTQTRVVVCVTPYGYIADASTCNPATKPATSQVCASYSCFSAVSNASASESSSEASSSSDSHADSREPVTYSWSTSVYSACSASCGQGTQTRFVVCTDNFGNAVSSASCSDEAPPSTRPCSGPKCSSGPTSSSAGEWRAYSWSECSSECGGGRQHRSVLCVSSTTSQWLPASACADDSAPRPASTQTCNQQPCGNKFDSICYPEYCGAHGSCQVEYGQMYCVCQEGYSGPTCRLAPSISAVNVTKGPSGLVVTWQHTGDAKAQVGLYLVPTATNISQVAMRQTENTGSATLPSAVTNGLVGTYVVEVVASALARSASAPFNLFACESDSDCSGHGKCSDYQCECTDGYSGPTCRVPAPAPSSACRPGQCLNGGACLVQNAKAVCDCSATKGFTGARCELPPACSSKSPAPKCLNGGVPSSSCKSCQCSGNWKGSDCGQCALNCSGHGKPSSDCSTCICDTDRAGSACNQQFRTVTIGPFFFNSAGLSAAENVTFNQQLLSDIAVGFGLSPSSLSVESLSRDPSSGGVFVTLRVLSSAGTSSSSQSSELDELLSVLQRSMGSSNSTFYRAAISSRLSFDDRSMIVAAPDSDPSTPSGNPADSGSSGSSSSFIPAVVGSVTGGVALVAAIAAVVVIRRRRAASASGSSRSADTEAEDAHSTAGAKPYEAEPVMMSRSPSPGISRSPSPAGEAASGFIPDQDVREISISEVDTV